MMVSTKGRYALLMLIDLAEHQKDGYTALKDIAGRQDISEKYLESISSILVRNGLVTGLRGKGGGYRLAAEPGMLKVGRVLRLTEGDLAPVYCVGDSGALCDKTSRCRIKPVWQKLDEIISEYLDSVTILDLISFSESTDEKDPKETNVSTTKTGIPVLE